MVLLLVQCSCSAGSCGCLAAANCSPLPTLQAGPLSTRMQPLPTITAAAAPPSPHTRSTDRRGSTCAAHTRVGQRGPSIACEVRAHRGGAAAKQCSIQHCTQASLACAPLHVLPAAAVRRQGVHAAQLAYGCRHTRVNLLRQPGTCGASHGCRVHLLCRQTCPGTSSGGRHPAKMR